MRNAFYFLSLLLLFSSCSIDKEPIFIKVDDLTVLKYAADTLTVEATAFFKNPNDVGGSISADEMKVLVNDIEVAQMFLSDFEVPARNEFSIPLRAKIPTKKLLNADKNGVLGSILNTIIAKKVNIRISGNLEYSIFGFKKNFLVDHTTELKIKF
jgi:hypothetical protein